MWTYSRNFPRVAQAMMVQRHPFSCEVSSPCVQRQLSRSTFGRLIAELNLSSQFNRIRILSKNTSVGRDHFCPYSISQTVGKEFHKNETAELYRNSDDEISVEQGQLDNYDEDMLVPEELQKERDIWNVGPAFRPSFNLASFVNESELLQEFLKMGVELHKWEHRKPELLEYILKLDFQKDVSPFVRFLSDNGVPPDRLSYHFTHCPYILKEDLQNLNIRIEYLKCKAFTTNQIHTIIDTNPKWITFTTIKIDERLGFFQTYFKLTGPQVRELATIGAKLITTRKAQVMDVTFKVKEEMGFNPDEVVSMLMSHPNIWTRRSETIWRRFDYLHNTIKFSHEVIVQSPKLLMTREGRLRGRIGYLQSLARAQFNPTKPNFVSCEAIISGDDAHFAVNVAKSSVIHFNEYLKSL